MMKKWILFLLFIPALTFADIEGVSAPAVEGLSSSTVEGVSVNDLPETCTEGSTVDVCTTSGGQNVISQGYTYGFRFTIASPRSDYGISPRINVSSGSTDVEIRVGTSSDLSTYIARGFATVTSTSTNNYEAIQWEDSGGNPMKMDFAASTYYYVGLMPTNGSVNWQRGTGDVCSGMSHYYSSSSGWNMDSNNTNDPNNKYIGCAE